MLAGAEDPLRDPELTREPDAADEPDRAELLERAPDDAREDPARDEAGAALLPREPWELPPPSDPEPLPTCAADEEPVTVPLPASSSPPPPGGLVHAPAAANTITTNRFLSTGASLARAVTGPDPRADVKCAVVQ